MRVAKSYLARSKAIEKLTIGARGLVETRRTQNEFVTFTAPSALPHEGVLASVVRKHDEPPALFWHGREGCVCALPAVDALDPSGLHEIYQRV